MENSKNKKTILVFSGDIDKALAAFVIANGALAMDDEVTMFFAFWGLNILRRPEKVKTKKSFMEAMFAWMMPRGAGKLGMSKMNFGGMGAWMMKLMMKQKKVDSIGGMIKTAQEAGARMIVCTMSMDVMGFKEEEFIDGVEFAGVATYLAEASEADVNLFI
ncbi:MAG: hypothetical protein C4589_06445 [Peptococcaceae bacterium]|nr:MAG: hypothetical protein C4589_06445 [Peptococcaceae bacterium]